MIDEADELFPEVAQAHGIDGHGKVKNDPRITKIGRFLRRYWLDETPQILKLLSGEMRLVGIRPKTEEYWQLFPAEDRKKALRYRPALCGIDYLCKGDSLQDLIKFERGYLDEKEAHSFLTDVKYFSKLMHGIVFCGIRGY